jgi:hypothetical protein
MKKVPAIWLFFPYGYTSHGGDCYMSVDRTQSIMFIINSSLFLLALDFLGSWKSLLKVTQVSARSDSFRIVCIAMCFAVPPWSSLKKHLEASLLIHIEILRGLVTVRLCAECGALVRHSPFKYLKTQCNHGFYKQTSRWRKCFEHFRWIWLVSNQWE